jgi:hypothetical protein
MARSDLRSDVRKFLSEYITSIEQLETLLLMRRSPDRTWDADAINDELRTSLASAAQRLSELERRRLIVADSSSPLRYRYEPADDQTGRIIDLVADAYRERRVAVITFIFSKPQDAILKFADAFRLGKGKTDG